MSLFQARLWWRAKIDAEEEYDGGGFCCENIDNAEDGSGSLPLGSALDPQP